MNRSIIALVLVLAAASPAAAQAPAPAEQIAEIREMVLYARFREAMSALDAYLGRTDLDALARNAGLETLATAQLATRDEASARQTLALLYARDPEHRLGDPDASPVVQAAFQRARSRRGEAIAVELTHESPGELPSRRAPTVEVDIGEGGDAVQEIRLSYQQEAGGRWVRVDVDVADGAGSARIPLAGGDQAYSVRYYFEALAPSRTVVATVGTRSEPLELTVPAPRAQTVAIVPTPTGPSSSSGEVDEDEGGIATKWWFWTIVGTVVVAGAVTGGVVATSGTDAPPNGTLGTFTLMP